ncbi:MAG TPA: esterase-like activity of phytase family protein [Hyphomonadaceae bacterium]|jgi:hypothetical protein|nr:esterase-like activity of phytase family protein [Hyphomonadaceae bacterium]
MRRLSISLASAALLVACASNAPVESAPPPIQPAQPTPPLVADAPLAVTPALPAAPLPDPAAAAPRSFDAYLASLKAASCPAGTRRAEPEAVSLSLKTVPLQALNPSRKVVGDLTLVGGFHLTSTDARFGGLSGIDVLDNGNLLAVSDVGDFVWINLAKDGVTPVSAKIGSMKDAEGRALRGKAEGDSEGVAVNGGMALVSFERDHRVLAYDLAACGAAARGAPLTLGGYSSKMPDGFAQAKIAVDENQGPEALAVTRDWYLFTGIETKVGDESPLSARPLEAPFDFNLRVGEGAPEFVGLDLVETGGQRPGVRAFSLHRAFTPLSGNAITIFETDFDRVLDQSSLPARVVDDIDERSHYRFREKGRHRLAQLNILYNIDNFEGIAAKEMPDGHIRLYVISDNNFSTSQRTLLYVFDVKK